MVRRRQPEQDLQLEILIPGDPVPQGRPRASRAKHGPGIIVRDPSRSRSWKAYVQGLYVQALEEAGVEAPWAAEGEAVAVELLCAYRLPKSYHRKRSPTEASFHTGARADVDNLLKAALDAGNGVLWNDDAQVVSAKVVKLRASQGSPGRSALRVEKIDPREAWHAEQRIPTPGREWGTD